MAKTKKKWVCEICGYESASYLGKCPDCESWSSFEEQIIQSKSAEKSKNQELLDHFDSYIEPQLLRNIEVKEEICFTSGFSEFDRVLGKGIVENSLVLIGGDPGIGKSTLLLQMCGNLSQMGINSLYISAEESPKQVKLRAERLGINTDNLYIFAQTNVNSIVEEAQKLEPKIIVVDSIQAIYNPAVSSMPGSISQIRECSNLLLTLAKYGPGSVFIIGHVTKEGAIAGPKLLEHMVDTVLYFEGDNYKTYRILRTVKNRYGNTNEIGIFNMRANGLEEVFNPSELFLSQRGEETSPGSAIIATIEGTRPLLVEVQALVGPTSYPSPRRVANGLEYSRLLQILAVLEKKIGLSLSKFDVYANIAGGIDIDEPAADLGIAMAIISSARNVTVDNTTVLIGEIGLTGEIRGISNLESRVTEAFKQGFKKVILPQASVGEEVKSIDIEKIAVDRLVEAISKAIL